MNRIACLLPVLALSLSACQSISNAVGSSKARPDEFAVVSKAPLVVPPEYSLLPPRAGESRDVATDQQARAALLGAQRVANASDAEQLLVAKAGGLSADSSIRVELDRDVSGVAYKQRSFADRILFWNDGGDDATGLDPDEEALRLERIQNAIGEGSEVEIERDRSVVSKLPGL